MLAVVTSVTPLEVRLKGTLIDIPIWRKASSSATPSEGDLVQVSREDRKYVLNDVLVAP